MKVISLFVFVFGAFFSNAQFEIDSFLQEDQFEDVSKFPIIQSSENPKAAERINIILHHRMLEKIYRQDDANRFDQVFPPEGEFHGASDFDFEILANNKRFLSIAISCAYTGAYSEYYTQYFSFDTKSGQPIKLSDMFGQESSIELSEWVSSAVYVQIHEFMNAIDMEDEESYGQEQYEMYAECASWYEEPRPLSEESYYLTDSTITFVKGRCSNHMMMALDDLWEFHEEYTLDELYSMMSKSGMSLMDGNGLTFETIAIPDGKVMEGNIGGKYPITMILNHSYDDNYLGIYWYNKVQKPIKLGGEVDDAAFFHLTESVNDKVTGEMDVQVILGGTLEGDWKNSEGTKKLDISVSIAR